MNKNLTAVYKMSFSGKVMPKPVSSNGPYPLSRDQLDFYWDHGYMIIKQLYDIPTLNLFRDRFVEICNLPTVGKHYSLVKDKSLYKENVSPEIYINKVQELLFDDVYMKYSEDPKLLHIVSQIIGDELTAINCMLINKPPGSSRHPSHQDMYYFPFRPADKIIASWTAIDPVSRDNGCLYVVPRSHKIESLYIHQDMAAVKNQFYYGILKEDIVAPLELRVDLEMDPGDTVFFHPYLVHGSGTNDSKRCRKAITAHYRNSKCYYIDVRGTPQEVLSTVMETELRRRGATIDFVDIWRIKCKPIKRFKSNL